MNLNRILSITKGSCQKWILFFCIQHFNDLKLKNKKDIEIIMIKLQQFNILIKFYPVL